MTRSRRAIAPLCLVALLTGCSADPAPHATLLARGVGPSTSARLAAPPARAAAAPPLRVMSFNLRRKFHLDGFNFWEHRKDIAARTILAHRPDVVGTQECLADQRDDLLERLPGYRFVGVGRDDGREGGEMCGIFFRSGRFALLDRGHFWLSKRPDRAGSKSWGSGYPRMTTWVKLGDRASGREFFLFNTHLDHGSSRARREGAKLIREQIAKIAGRSPVVLTGDFNDSDRSEPHRILAHAPTAKRTRSRSDTRGGASGGGSAGLVDTFVARHGGRARGMGTRHGFDGSTGGDRIDWILASGPLTAIDANIIRTDYDGRYPSDHFPVTATLAWPVATAAAATSRAAAARADRSPMAAAPAPRDARPVQWQ